MLLIDDCKDEVSTQSVKSVNVKNCLVFLECIIMNYKCISTAKPSLILYLRHQLLLLIYLMVILFEVVWIYCKSSYKIKKIKKHIFVLPSFCNCLKRAYGSSLRSISSPDVNSVFSDMNSDCFLWWDWFYWAV